MIRIRMADNGYYWIPRHDRETEAHLDQTMERVGNELMWRPRIDVDTFSFTRLKHMFTEEVYVIGKGKSIDEIDDETLDRDKCIVCINDAGAVIEALGYTPITIIQDVYDQFKLPVRSPLVVRDSGMYRFVDKEPYIFSKQALGMKDNRATSIYAVAMAALFGAKKAIMLGFDSITTGSLEYSSKAANPANRENRNHVIQCQKQFLLEIADEKEIELEFIESVSHLNRESTAHESTAHESTAPDSMDNEDNPSEEESDTQLELDLPCIEDHAYSPSE